MKSKLETTMRLHADAIHLLRRVRLVDEKMGLSPARASVLSILVFGGPRTLTELARAEQVAAPTMTKLVTELERLRLVTRSYDAADGRIRVITATAKARRILLKGRARRIEYLTELMVDTTAAEWKALERGLAAVERALAGDDRRKSHHPAANLLATPTH